MSEWFRVAFGELYPLVYPHRDMAEAARVAARIAPIVKAAGPTLDVACGNGRYMLALQNEGVDMVGVDLSEYLLGEAVKHGQAGRVVCGDMRALPFATGVFASAINMFTSFGYFDDDGDNARALGEMARVISAGGAFVMDTINGERVRGGVRPRSRRAAGDAVIEEAREVSADGRRLTKRVEVSRPGRRPVAYSEQLRLYDRGELTAMLAAAGFEIRRVHGDYELGDYSPAQSPRLLFVCNRRRTDA